MPDIASSPSSLAVYIPPPVASVMPSSSTPAYVPPSGYAPADVLPSSSYTNDCGNGGCSPLPATLVPPVEGSDRSYVDKFESDKRAADAAPPPPPPDVRTPLVAKGARIIDQVGALLGLREAPRAVAPSYLRDVEAKGSGGYVENVYASMVTR